MIARRGKNAKQYSNIYKTSSSSGFSTSRDNFEREEFDVDSDKTTDGIDEAVTTKEKDN